MKGILSIFSRKGKKPTLKQAPSNQLFKFLTQCLNFVSQHLRNERLYQSNHISKETTELMIELRGGTFKIGMLDTVSELSFITDAIVGLLTEYEPVFTYTASALLIKPNADISDIISQLPPANVKFLELLFKHIDHVVQCNAASTVDVVNVFGAILIDPLDDADQFINERNEVFTTILRNHEALFGGGVYSGMERDQVRAAATVQDRSIKITFPKTGYILSDAELQKKMSTFGKIGNVSWFPSVCVRAVVFVLPI